MNTLKTRKYMRSAKDIWDQITSDIEDSAGVYKLHCLDENLSKGLAIHRLLGVDEEGTLYIGSSSAIRDRIAKLRGALSASAGRDGFAAPGAHPCGHKYKATNIHGLLPYDRLCVTVHPTSPDENHGKLEADALDEYEKRYGETPPFNEGRPRAKWQCG